MRHNPLALGAGVENRYDDDAWELNPDAPIWKDAGLFVACGNDSAAIDASPYGHRGDVVGAEIGHAINRKVWEFNGSSDYINFGDVCDIGAGDFSFGAWFRYDNVAGQEGTVLGKSYAGPGDGRWWISFYDGELTATIAEQGGNRELAVAEGPYRQTGWHRIDCVYRRFASFSMMIDGAVVDTVGVSGVNNYQTDYLCVVGAYPARDKVSITLSRFLGAITDCTVLHRAISLAEHRLFCTRRPDLDGAIVGNQLYAPHTVAATSGGPFPHYTTGLMSGGFQIC